MTWPVDLLTTSETIEGAAPLSRSVTTFGWPIDLLTASDSIEGSCPLSRSVTAVSPSWPVDLLATPETGEWPVDLLVTEPPQQVNGVAPMRRTVTSLLGGWPVDLLVTEPPPQIIGTAPMERIAGTWEWYDVVVAADATLDAIHGDAPISRTVQNRIEGNAPLSRTVLPDVEVPLDWIFDGHNITAAQYEGKRILGWQIW